jgi:hypothetical protein
LPSKRTFANDKHRGCATIALLGVGLKNTLTIPGGNSFSALLHNGIGAIEPWLIMYMGTRDNASGLIEATMMANVAQVALSLVYFTYNSVFTRMYAALEYSGYGRRRKGLRVSTKPQGAQRCTHFLELPYRVALPLMAISGLLHWLVSQSIFFVDIDKWAYQGSDSELRYSGSQLSCGYSPLAIVVVLVVVVFMILFAVWTGSRKLHSDIPVASSCSAAISAACHPSLAELKIGGAAFKELRWGVIHDRGGIGNCSFTSAGVLPLEEGMLYA